MKRCIRDRSLAAALFIALATSFGIAPKEAIAADDPISFATHDLYPFGYQRSDGAFVGTAVDVVRCVMEKVDRPFNIEVVGWKRAQKTVETGRFDAFLAASQNETRDRFATLSATIADQNWTWFFLKSNPQDPTRPSFRKQALVSSWHGANMQGWLQDNGYQTLLAPPTDADGLLEQLLDGEIDAALDNEQAMIARLTAAGHIDHVTMTLNQSKPLGVYFGHHFLAKDPDFLATFNRHVVPCRDVIDQRTYNR